MSKLQNMLEKFNSLNDKAEELKALMKILRGIDYDYKESNHFEFVEHYGLHADRISIPKNIINESLMLSVKLLMR